jgi:glycosyltransferase involved in cell wall biosynthesis
MPLNAHSDDEPRRPLRIHGVIWNALTGLSLGYALTEILASLPAGKIEPNLWCLRGNLDDPRDFERVALPGLVFRALCKAGVSMATQGRLGSMKVLRQIRPGDVVYIWPPYDLPLIRGARERGAIVIAERTNCMATMCREVLTAAYARRGLPLPDNSFTDADIACESAEVMACDFVTAPNAFVARSLRESGILEERIIETSYGFSPTRLADAIAAEKPARPPIYAFVGFGIVRKGLDVLLEAWEQADIEGELLIAGLISDDLRAAYSHILMRADVREVGYVRDVAKIYAAADVFVFPTHEEGGPLVTYEASACGLASIVSPMGAGRIIRHEQEGLVIDPLNVEELAAAIRLLAENPTLRRQLGANATIRSREFTWDRVGNRFFEKLRDISMTYKLLSR